MSKVMQSTRVHSTKPFVINNNKIGTIKASSTFFSPDNDQVINVIEYGVLGYFDKRLISLIIISLSFLLLELD
jgi:hypothetical protein